MKCAFLKLIFLSNDEPRFIAPVMASARWNWAILKFALKNLSAQLFADDTLLQ